MTLKKNLEFDKEKKFHKVLRKNKDNKYRKKPYDYLYSEDDLDDDFDDDYTVDLDDVK